MYFLFFRIVQSLINRKMTYLERGLQKHIKTTRYQECINAASVEICLQNSAALVNRAALTSSAREKIMKEGFVFAKGKSRSKLPVKPCRQYLSKELRTSRLKYLDDLITNNFIQRTANFFLSHCVRM